MGQAAHPQRLGKYQITGVLGEGAMGVVYRGFDPDIRRLVALKTIRRGAGDDAAMHAAESAARFRNEAQAAGRLQHPGIVSVYDFGDDGHIAYIAMEFVEGRTLSQYLAQRLRFEDADIASIADQLLDALQHAHQNGVWHRDVKPSNVILTPTGRVKIADFGIARSVDSGQLTMAHSVLGTPMYMAPEQFTGRAIDHRVDLYATGVLLYQLVAGRPPFVGPPEVLMYKVVNEAAPPPSTAEGGPYSARFDAVIAAALAKDREQRHADAATFRSAVSAALAAPVPHAVSPALVQALQPLDAFPPTERMPSAAGPALPAHATGSTGTAAVPSHFDAAELARVEASLTQHVGPLARVMVRRTARQSRNLEDLYMRLGEQITSNAARDAFLGQASRAGIVHAPTHGSPPHGNTSQGTAGSGSAQFERTEYSGSRTGATHGGGPSVSDDWLAQALPLLATHIGPIAKVVLRRALERSRQRDVLCHLLAEAVPAADRAALLAQLARLP